MDKESQKETGHGVRCAIIALFSIGTCITAFWVGACVAKNIPERIINNVATTVSVLGLAVTGVVIGKRLHD